MQTVNMKNFLADKNSLKELFAQIVIYSRPHVRKNRHGMNDKVAVEEVLLYFSKDCSAFLTNNLVCNSLVIISAFEFALNKARTIRSAITEKQFQRFTEAMFLYSHLWELFLGKAHTAHYSNVSCLATGYILYMFLSPNVV